MSLGLTTSASMTLLALNIFLNRETGWLFVLLIIIVLGAIETFYSIRVGFDNRLLQYIAKSNTNINEQLSNLDKSLIELKLLPLERAEKPLAERLTGCMTLFKRQLFLCCLQMIILILAALFSFLL